MFFGVFLINLRQVSSDLLNNKQLNNKCVSKHKAFLNWPSHDFDKGDTYLIIIFM